MDYESQLDHLIKLVSTYCQFYNLPLDEPVPFASRSL
jgi:hypothetical protein